MTIRIMYRPAWLFAVVALLVFGAGTLGAQAVRPVLSDADVKKFITDFPEMSRELDEIDSELVSEGEEMPDLRQVASEMRANAEAMNIFRKYGWNQSFVEKYVAIMGSFAVVRFEEMRGEMDQQVNEQLAEIDSNTALSAEQKAQMKQGVSSWVTQIDTLLKAYRQQVHPRDIEVVRANRDGLQTVFEE